MVRLVPMSEDEFRSYLQRSIADYAQDHVKAGNWDAADALQKSEQEFRQLLPDGLASKQQHLFSIEDSETGVKVGLIWFAERAHAARPSAFIYDFLIYEEHRRKGYGGQALLAVEEKVKELGIETIGLHVFAHNQAAIDLYKKIGYQMTDIQMAKKLRV